MVDFEGPLETEIPKHIKNWWSFDDKDKNNMIYWLKRYKETKEYQKKEMESEI